MKGPSSASGGQDFKELLQKCLRQAGLNPRTLHRELRRQRIADLPENTIDSWLRPHSTTGRPSLPREETVALLGEWLCSRDGVTATESELLAAWRADTSYWAAKRARPAPPTAGATRAPVVAAESEHAAPLGVVTFLSARICAWGQLRRRDVEVAGHRLLGQAVAAHGGSKVRSDHDEFLAAFAEPADAVRAAIAGQQGVAGHLWPEGVRVRVSMAIHGGRVAHSATGYAGVAVHQVSRMADAAHAGQVVVSEAAQALVGSNPPEGASMADLGKPRLSDLSTPHRLYALCHPDLEAGFPPLKSLDAYPNNLPLQLTAFIGRGEQLEELRRALVSSRLCTLAGSGGVGKTRLALQFAAELVEDFDDGVWLVDLASTGESELVAQVVASVLGVREGGTGTYAAKARRQQRPLALRLADHLRPRHLLLLLDNCEHVVAAVAALVEGLLRACPGLQVLCTSREPLGVAGELVHRVPPLAVPPAAQALSVEEIAAYESVRLFLDRAAQRRPDLGLAASDMGAIMEICQRVEGSALGIELAAARVKMLSVRQILDLLEDRFALLSSGSRTAAARHQTLRAMIDWSHDDLSASQKMLFRRLSVFVGGFELAAAQQVCAGEGLERFEILDLLGMLVDKSLVETDQHADVIRYRLLETIRTYAGERLADCGEEARVRARHRDWYLALAEDAEPGLTGAEQLRWLDLLELDHDNLRAALERGSDPEDAQESLRLAAALGHFWLVRGFISEGRDHLQRALAGARPVSALRAKALAVAGYLAMFDADVDAAAEHSEAALELSAELGYRRGEAWALRTLGWVAINRERLREAVALNQRALGVSRELSDDWGTAFSLTNLANLQALQGQFSDASSHYEESLAIRRDRDDAWGLTWSLFRLGVLRTWQGRFDEADRLLAEGLGLADRLRYRGGAVLTLLGLGEAAHLRGNQATANSYYVDAYARARDLEDQSALSLSLVGLATVATESKDHAGARRHLGSDEHGPSTTAASTRAPLLRAEARLAHTTGDLGRATELHRQLLILRQRSGDMRATTEELEDIATLIFTGGNLEGAATLLAAAQSFRCAMGAPVPPLYRDRVEAISAALRAPGHPEAVYTAWAKGSSLPVDQAAAIALATRSASA